MTYTPPLPDWRTPENRALLTRLLARLDQTTPSVTMAEGALVVDGAYTAWPKIRVCLLATLNDAKNSDCHKIIEHLANTNTPLMLFAHQFGVLRNLVLKEALAERDIDVVEQVMNLFGTMEEEFAAIYLKIFLNRLGTRNHVRLGHIRALHDQNLLSYFESHLVWMERLIEAVRLRRQDVLPELDPTRCQFGQWLNSEGLQLIRDRSHVKQIQLQHETMHHVVAEMQDILLLPQASSLLYALLRKAEIYSLELGNEISLLNNVVIMNVYSKDALTGFLSRRFLDRVLFGQMEVAKATEMPFSVIMFDLDHFKVLNDTYGHLAGDKALVHVANLVRETLRQSDLVFRYGGEEFMLVCPSTNLLQARLLAEKLREKIAASPLQGEIPIALSASFGVSEVSPDSYQVVDSRLIEEIISTCDGHLYAAKRNGRNCVA